MEGVVDVMVEGIVIYKILVRLDDSRWCALTLECAQFGKMVF